MRGFSDFTIRGKLITVILAVSLCVALLSAVVIGVYQYYSLQQRAIDEVESLADLFGANVHAPLMFNDAQAASDLLKSFELRPSITHAILYDQQGRVFAEYKIRDHKHSEVPINLELHEAVIRGRELHYYEPLVFDRERIGTLHVEASLDEIYQHLWRYLVVLAVLVVAAGGLAFALATTAQRIISKPIHALAAVIRQVTAFNNYTLRAEKISQDEVGELIDGFNHMIEAVQRRDEELEGRVMARTRELQDEIEIRANVEQALLREQKQLRELLSNAPVSIVMLNEEHRIVTFSKRLLSDFEIADQDLTGLKFEQIFPALAPHWWLSLQRAMLGERLASAEDSIQLGSRTIYISWAMQPWYKPEGQQGGVIIVIERIDELVEAREDAIKTAQLKFQFLANVSHEIRTPLNGIIGFSSLLSEQQLPEEARSQVEVVSSAAKSLLMLINDLLDFSKLDSGKMQLESTPFSPAEMGHSLRSLFELECSKKSIAFKLEMDPRLPMAVMGDEYRLRQVLTNLIGNAIKFTPHGEVGLEIRWDSSGPAQSVIDFCVRDSGIGIPAERHQAIFEAFTQADGSTTRRFGGTGLGLSISAQLVRLMGGEIKLVSAPQQGSTFSFKLLMTHGAVSAKCLPQEGHRDFVVEGRAIRVLVAEDNAMNQKLMQMLLSKAGYEATFASNGREAVEQFERQQFDIVLMDIQMPVMGGVEAADCIRKLEQPGAKHVPIIALTADAFAENRERCLKAGLDGFVTKPVNRRELFNVMSELLSSAKGKE